MYLFYSDLFHYYCFRKDILWL